jgi:hypothetical protein
VKKRAKKVQKMNQTNFLVIFWLTINIAISLPLNKIIYNHISVKSLLTTTLVDMIYRDTIIYLYLLISTASTALVHLLLENGSSLTLNYNFSVFYATTVMFFMGCVTASLVLSGSLRFLSLLRNSEAQGLLILGPENIAIKKVRLLSMIASFTFQCVMIFKLDAHSGLFYLLSEPESKSHFEGYQENYYTTLYLVWPISAIAINAITKIYSIHLRKGLNNTVSIFTIESQEPTNIQCTEKFSFSLNAVIAIPLMIAFAVVSSVANRQTRLLILYPFQMTLMGVVLPLLIILKEQKMNNIIFEKMSLFDLNKFSFSSCKKLMSSSITPAT